MFSVGEDVEADALFKRGWTVSAIARHLGRDRQGGGHVEDLFAGPDQLLGQQVAGATGRLDGPGPLCEGLCPQEQLVGLLSCSPDGDGGELGLVRPDGNRSVGCLMGINTDDDGHAYLLVRWWNREGTPDADRGARSSFEPLTARNPTRSSSFESQAAFAVSRHIVSNPIRSSERYGSTAVSATSLNQVRLGALHRLA